MQFSMRINVPLPNKPAAYDPPPDPKTGINQLPLATLAQWTPPPNSNNSRLAFAVAVATALKIKPNASHFCLTTKQSYQDFADMCNGFGGQYDGFKYLGEVINPSLYPLLPVLGVKGGPTMGDSAQAFAELLWLKDKAGHPQNSYIGEAEFARSAMAYNSGYAGNDVPLDAMFIDLTQQEPIKQLFAGSTTPDWIARGDKVLSMFAATGIKVIFKVPAPASLTDGIKAFLNKVKQFIGAQASWACSFPVGSIVREQFAAACGGPFIDYFNVTMTGALVHADGTGSEPAMDPPTFKNQVMTNPSYADRHVMIECGGDSLLVLNQL